VKNNMPTTLNKRASRPLEEMNKCSTQRNRKTADHRREGRPQLQWTAHSEHRSRREHDGPGDRNNVSLREEGHHQNLRKKNKKERLGRLLGERVWIGTTSSSDMGGWANAEVGGKHCQAW